MELQVCIPVAATLPGPDVIAINVEWNGKPCNHPPLEAPPRDGMTEAQVNTIKEMAARYALCDAPFTVRTVLKNWPENVACELPPEKQLVNWFNEHKHRKTRRGKPKPGILPDNFDTILKLGTCSSPLYLYHWHILCTCGQISCTSRQM
jgi:hypothetical protein